MKKIMVVVFVFLLHQNTIGQNTNLGTGAGNAGTQNTSIGYYSGDVVTGNYNSFLGSYSGNKTTTGTENSFFGSNAGLNNTTGRQNVFIGYSSGTNNISGNSNSFVGWGSGSKTTTGSYNSFFGLYSGATNSTGLMNSSFGYYAGSGNNGSYNIFLGGYAGGIGAGNNNVLIGSYAGDDMSTGSNNVLVGYKTGLSITTGEGNVFLGYNTGYSETGSNKLYIDNSSTATPLIYGDFSSNQLGINILPNTTHALTVGGTIHATGIYVNGSSITDGGFEFWTKVGTNIWNNSGNVGIGVALSGTNNPNNYKLAVKGKIGAHEVQIENNSITWSDFVFDDDYKLISLAELEQYIKANHHLPEIPTQQEVRDNGILLSEMNAKLLQKVEELTLYMIEMKKELDSLKSKVDENKH